MKTASQKFDEMERSEPQEEKETPHSEHAEFLKYVKEPMAKKTTIPDYAMSEEQSHARPEAGTTSRGKSNDEKAALGTVRQGSAIEDAKSEGETAKKAIATQIGLNKPDGNGYRGN